MTARKPKSAWSGWTKFIGLLIAGGLTGFLAASLGMSALEEGGALASLQGAELALMTAFLYLLMGAMVGFGTLAPRAGAAILNVEDADEIREDGASLGSSALGSIIMAAILVLLALGSPEVGVLSPASAGYTALLLAIVATGASWRSWKGADELMRDVMRDAGAISFYILFVGLGLWAAAAHLGFAPGPRPLDIVALLFAVPLLAAFWSVGRRGMMRPRG